MHPTIILASASQRRQQFLRDLGLMFSIRLPDIDETPLPNEDPAAMTVRLAEAKAQAVARQLFAAYENVLIIASDTTVALDGKIYGKPEHAADAMRMLRDLRNRTHEVISAVTVLQPATARIATRVNRTAVTMRNYSDAEIDAYVASGDPMDKAGAYAIQSLEFAPVCALDGCFASVMGLPLVELGELLATFGVTTPRTPLQVCSSVNPFPCCAASAEHSVHIQFVP
uniref:dTTP/UTP pyrophosphatase n=1 Tax=Caldilinea aerophila TaxID=133453 RepID=A0A7C1FDM0_9CHLR